GREDDLRHGDRGRDEVVREHAEEDDPGPDPSQHAHGVPPVPAWNVNCRAASRTYAEIGSTARPIPSVQAQRITSASVMAGGMRRGTLRERGGAFQNAFDQRMLIE